jgi:hypothetical protein
VLGGATCYSYNSSDQESFYENGISCRRRGRSAARHHGVRAELDVTYWNYGYPFWRPWRWWAYGPAPVEQVNEYTQGTIIVDVIDPNTKQLLWRGQGVSDVSDDPRTYARELAKTVTAIVDKFPHAHAQVAQRT